MLYYSSHKGSCKRPRTVNGCNAERLRTLEPKHSNDLERIENFTLQQRNITLTFLTWVLFKCTEIFRITHLFHAIKPG